MLKIQNLDVWFFKGTVNEHHGLNHLNLDVETGEFVTLVGSNGAGKSTLFNAICGTVAAQSGRITLDEEETEPTPAKSARAAKTKKAAAGKKAAAAAPEAPKEAQKRMSEAQLEAAMNEAAMALDFEKAAEYRDRLLALRAKKNK